jgi:urease subunit beta
MIPGEIIPAGEPVTVNEGLPVTRLEITNTGPVVIQLTAHFHVFEANRHLQFDRRKAFGMRLDVHAKGAVRFPPGETRRVDLVPIGGERVVHGFNDAVNGRLDDIDAGEAACRLAERGFLDTSGQGAV